jgi:predicted aspartyl protease
MSYIRKILVAVSAAALLAGCATRQQGINAAYKQVDVCTKEVVSRPEYAAVRAHFHPGEIPVSALTDDRRPTPEEARLVVARWDAGAPCRQAFLAGLASSPANRPDGAQVFSAAYVETASLVARFSKGGMTWGQYAHDNQAIRTAVKAQLVAADAAVAAGINPIAAVQSAMTVAPTQPAFDMSTASPSANGHSEIALHKAGGTFTVPASINGVMTLEFTLDSGAMDVSIPADVALTLMRTGTIDRGDFLGNRTYGLADGSTAPSPTFRIRSLRVGDREARNVTASIAPVKGPLLLGESFLRQFGAWSIDNRRGVLVLD